MDVLESVSSRAPWASCRTLHAWCTICTAFRHLSRGGLVQASQNVVPVLRNPNETDHVSADGMCLLLLWPEVSFSMVQNMQHVVLALQKSVGGATL